MNRSRSRASALQNSGNRDIGFDLPLEQDQDLSPLANHSDSGNQDLDDLLENKGRQRRVLGQYEEEKVPSH